MGAGARVTSYWRALVSRVGSAGKERRKFTSSTAPRLSPNTATANAYAHEHDHKNKFLPVLRGDFVPVYVSLGLVLLALTFATHTMKQQIERNPNVYVSKKKRRTFPEVKDPDYAEKKSQEMINKSFFRRIAHIQDHYDYLQNNNPVPDTIRGDPISTTRGASHKSVSLKSVGVDP